MSITRVAAPGQLCNQDMLSLSESHTSSKSFSSSSADKSDVEPAPTSVAMRSVSTAASTCQEVTQNHEHQFEDNFLLEKHASAVKVDAWKHRSTCHKVGGATALHTPTAPFVPDW